jgi:WD40 repeat protein
MPRLTNFVNAIAFAVVSALPILDAAPVPVDTKPTDRYGDPLPLGAISRLGTLRFRHAAQVVAVVYSADGKLMATAGYDETVRLWETATGKEKFSFRLEGKPSYSAPAVALSPDGSMLAAAKGDGALRVWDVDTGKERLKLDLPEKETTSAIAFGPGGRTLALLSWRHPGPGAATENLLRLWSVEKAAEVAAFQAPQGSPRAIAFSPDGKMLAIAQPDGLQLCEPDTGKKLMTIPAEKTPFRLVAFSADGTLATNGPDEKTVQLWDAGTGRPIRQLRGHEDFVRHLAYSADGKRLVTSSADNTFRVWDCAGGETLLVHRDIHAAIGFGCVALSPDGKTVAAGSINSVFALRRWDVATGKEAAWPQGQTFAVEFVAVTSDGKVVTGGRYGANTLHVWEPADGKLLSVLREDGFIYAVDLSSDGKTVAFVAEETVCLRDLGTGKEKTKLNGEAGSVGNLAFTPDGKTLAVGYCATTKAYVCTIMLWDVASGKKLCQFKPPGKGIRSVVFSPDGKTLVSDSDGLRIWDPATGDALGELPVKGAGVSGFGVVRFSPDGALLAAPSYPAGFGVWKVAKKEFVGRFDGDGVTVRSVAFSTDGRLFACGKEDGSVELWDVQTWKVVGKGRGPRGRVYALCFAAKDQTLISGHEDTTALVWDVPKLLAAAREKNERDGK